MNFETKNIFSSFAFSFSFDNAGHDDDFIFEEFARIRLKGHEDGFDEGESWTIRTTKGKSFVSFRHCKSKKNFCCLTFFILIVSSIIEKENWGDFSSWSASKFNDEDEKIVFQLE